MEDKTKWVPHHNPKIVFNEKALSLGAAVYAKVAMDWVKNQQRELERNQRITVVSSKL